MRRKTGKSAFYYRHTYYIVNSFIVSNFSFLCQTEMLNFVCLRVIMLIIVLNIFNCECKDPLVEFRQTYKILIFA